MNHPLLHYPSLFDIMGGENEENWRSMLTQTGVEVSEDDQMFHVKADLPGMKEDNIQVTIENGVLRIQGEREQEEKDNAKKYYSRSNSSYSYSLALPGQIDESQAPNAVYKDGVLCICFNKAKQNTAKRIQIQKQQSK
jgi:HSP20 family protein